MSETNGNGKRETLRLEVDQPVVASLLFDAPLQVQGRWGDQFMYTLQTDSGERVLYVDPAVRALIDQAGLRRGVSFKIGKMSRRDGNRRGIEWKVRRLDPEEPAHTPRELVAPFPVPNHEVCHQLLRAKQHRSANRPASESEGHRLQCRAGAVL